MEINGRTIRYQPSGSSRLQELLLLNSAAGSSSQVFSQNNNQCLICQNNYPQSICRPSGISQRVFNSCTKYLHSAITQDSFKDVSNKEKQLPLCQYCFESALELNQLSEQLEKFQKEINNVILTFSLNILHRRGQSRDGSISGKENVDVDISVLSLNPSQMAGFQRKKIQTETSAGFYVSQTDIDDEHQEDEDQDPAGESKDCSFEVEDSSQDQDESWNESENYFVGFLPNSEEEEVNEEQLGAPITTFSSYYDSNLHLEPNKLYSVGGGGTSQMLMPPEGEDIQDDEEEVDYEETMTVGEVMEPVETKPPPMTMRPFLSNHIIVRHKNNCKKCGKICSTSYNLLLHEKACNGKARYLSCHLCESTFSKRSALTRHFKAVHNQIQDIKPRLIGSPMVSVAASLVKTEPVNVKPPIIRLKPPAAPIRRMLSHSRHCSKCGKECSTDYNLTLHERACSGKKAIVPCKLCGKTFHMHSALLRHNRTVHSQERPFKCSACPKRFNRKEFLRNHFNRTHAVSDIVFQAEQYSVNTDNAILKDT